MTVRLLGRAGSTRWQGIETRRRGGSHISCQLLLASLVRTEILRGILLRRLQTLLLLLLLLLVRRFRWCDRERMTLLPSCPLRSAAVCCSRQGCSSGRLRYLEEVSCVSVFQRGKDGFFRRLRIRNVLGEGGSHDLSGRCCRWTQCVGIHKVHRAGAWKHNELEAESGAIPLTRGSITHTESTLSRRQIHLLQGNGSARRSTSR